MIFNKRGWLFLPLLLGSALMAGGGFIRNFEEESLPEVEATGSLLAIDAPGRDNAADTPAERSAAKVAVPDKLFEWTPSPDPGRVTGGADLIDALLSADQSLLILIEKVGGRRPPSGGRILMFNLFNNRLVNALPLEKTLPGPAALLPDGITLSLVCRAQPILKQPEQLMLLNLATGKRQLSAPLSSAVHSLTADAASTWITLEDGGKILRFDHSDFGGKPVELRTKIRKPGVTLTPDGKKLILFGDGGIELLDATGSETTRPEFRKLPEHFAPAWCVPASADGGALVLAEENGPALLLAGNVYRELAPKSGVPGCYREEGRKFLLPVPYRESLNLYTLPEKVEPESSASPGRLRPFSGADNFRVFFTSGPELEAILVDHRANFSRLKIRARRWDKSMIFEAP